VPIINGAPPNDQKSQRYYEALAGITLMTITIIFCRAGI
jgi:hypothetical protein